MGRLGMQLVKVYAVDHVILLPDKDALPLAILRLPCSDEQIQTSDMWR
jgi:hypothetical protein